MLIDFITYRRDAAGSGETSFSAELGTRKAPRRLFCCSRVHECTGSGSLLGAQQVLAGGVDEPMSTYANASASPLAAAPAGRLNFLTLKFHKKHLKQAMCLGQSVSRLVCVFHILLLPCNIIL